MDLAAGHLRETGQGILEVGVGVEPSAAGKGIQRDRSIVCLIRMKTPNDPSSATAATRRADCKC
jgi:hypothetical protein